MIWLQLILVSTHDSALPSIYWKLITILVHLNLYLTKIIKNPNVYQVLFLNQNNYCQINFRKSIKVWQLVFSLILKKMTKCWTSLWALCPPPALLLNRALKAYNFIHYYLLIDWLETVDYMQKIDCLTECTFTCISCLIDWLINWQ